MVRRVYRRPFRQGPSRYQSTRANLDHITDSIAQQDEESDFPFILNGVVQDPGMSEYQDMFNDAYILTWRAETSAWSIPAELRRYCNCNAAHFVGKLNPIGGLKPDDEVANYRSCSACSKLWCMRCGDPVGPSGLPDLPVSNHTGPTYCRDTWAIREAAREKLCQALKGLDHQLCPRCDAPTKARDEELRSECAACNLPFCFACGLSQCEYPEAESSDSGEEPAGETAR
jgi:hypothetical protein